MNIRYPIYEGVYRILTFESSPACHTLTVELTGFIQSYIEQYGI